MSESTRTEIRERDQNDDGQVLCRVSSIEGDYLWFQIHCKNVLRVQSFYGEAGVTNAFPSPFREPPASLVSASRVSRHPKEYSWTFAISELVVDRCDDSPGIDVN